VGVNLEDIVFNTPLTIRDWHARFRRQAQWTRDLRNHLFKQIKISKQDRILEVGCGTGAVLIDLDLPACKFGLDINQAYLSHFRSNLSRCHLTAGDAHLLPFATRSFDLTFCHFLLLWVESPVEVIREMIRVTHPGCAVIALAEPDYGGRIDFPSELAQPGGWQTEALRRQGAEPTIGRQINSIFHRAGLINIQTGVLGGQWKDPFNPDDWLSEWTTLVHDLNGYVPLDFLRKFITLDENAWIKGDRVLFVPTFYAIGWVP
jgi:ubiquinone/menaquinone biosynthesis C-methylase UbiE